MAYVDGSANSIRPTGITYPDGREVTVSSGHASITSPQFGQCWTLDPTGNWHGFRQDDDGSSTWDLIQARTSNPVNEITDIDNTTGPSWAVPCYGYYRGPFRQATCSSVQHYVAQREINAPFGITMDHVFVDIRSSRVSCRM
jgi:hypothetical protein